MTQDQLAWLSGLYEGEGHRQFHVRDSGSVSIALVIASTDRDVLETVQQMTGVGTITAETRREPWKALYRWRIHRREHVAALGRAMLPYLHERRRAQLLPLIEYCEQRLAVRGVTKRGSGATVALPA